PADAVQRGRVRHPGQGQLGEQLVRAQVAEQVRVRVLRRDERGPGQHQVDAHHATRLSITHESRRRVMMPVPPVRAICMEYRPDVPAVTSSARNSMPDGLEVSADAPNVRLAAMAVDMVRTIPSNPVCEVGCANDRYVPDAPAGVVQSKFRSELASSVVVQWNIPSTV